MQPTYQIDNPNLPYQTKLDLWQTGFGLQMVDGLVPSTYIEKLVENQARGEMTFADVSEEISHFHLTVSDETKEADLVSLRIAECLSQREFTFSPAMLLKIHETLFYGIFDVGIPIGQYRKTNISKRELVLNGNSVIYVIIP